MSEITDHTATEFCVHEYARRVVVRAAGDGSRDLNRRRINVSRAYIHKFYLYTCTVSKGMEIYQYTHRRTP